VTRMPKTLSNVEAKPKAAVKPKVAVKKSEKKS